MRKLFKGGNYSRAETIWGNTVFFFSILSFFFRFVDKFTEFLGSFVQSHLQMFESNIQFPALWCSKVYLNKTFKNIRIGNWALLSKCLRWILTNEPRNSVNLATNLIFFFSILKIGRFKGQLISKCPFGFIVWTKLPTKLFLNFCPEIFCTFLGASWKLFGASCRLPCLWYYILSPQEAQRASMKPPGSYKKTQGRNPEIISLVFLSKQYYQKDILKLTDL